MSNRYYRAKDLFRAGSLIYFDLNGKNSRDYISRKIKFKGKFTHSDQQMIQRNYEDIAQNLEVYPTVTVYSSNQKIAGGMAGLYSAEKNHIELHNNGSVISALAHEMRHAFQYIYYPDFFFASEYKNAVEYLDCPIEQDARAYSLEYCKARQYWSEVSQLEYSENQYALVIQKRMTPKLAGLSNSYFKRNRKVGVSVPREYHIAGSDYSSHSSTGTLRYIWYKIVGFYRFMVGLAVIVSIIFLLINFEEESEVVRNGQLATVEANQYEYIPDESSLSEFIDAYRYNYEIALVYEDFSYIQDMLQEDSGIYKEVKQYINQISGQEMVFDFTNLVIEDIEILPDYAIVHTFEEFDFQNAAGEWSEEARNKKYKVIISEDGYYKVAEITNK